MKRILAALLVLLLCLGMAACDSDSDKQNRDKERAEAVEADRLTNILCNGVWYSTDHRTNDTDFLGFYTLYDTLTFYENGTCVYTGKMYKDGKLNAENTFKENWKIEGGRIAVFPDIVDSDTDTIYYDYADGMLLGSAFYCDRPFTYTQK